MRYHALNYRCDCCGSTEPPAKTLENTPDLAIRLDPGSVVPAGECGKCGALCYIVPAPKPGPDTAKAVAACKALVSTIEATGGVIAFTGGTFAPAGDTEWIDLGDAYLMAKEALGQKNIVSQSYQEAP